jgi:hypothetical protein
MMLEHPQVARVSCADCKKFWFDPAKGEFVMRGGKRLERTPGTPLPCGVCPKKSPDNEKNCTLTEANQQVLELWYQFDACSWEGLPPACKGDRLLVRQFSLVNAVMKNHEKRQQGRMMADELMPFLLRN